MSNICKRCQNGSTVKKGKLRYLLDRHAGGLEAAEDWSEAYIRKQRELVHDKFFKELNQLVNQEVKD